MGNTSSNRFDDNPVLARGYRLLSWTVGIILLLTTLIYAGIRGAGAYHHSPVIMSRFIGDTSINFPAITVCPLEPGIPIIPIECITEIAQVEQIDCISTVTAKQVTLEGVLYDCVTFNEPQDSSKIITATSTEYEIIIEAYINSSLVAEDLGAFIVLHEQGVAPEVEEDNTFVADVGKVMEVFLRKTNYYYYNGTEETDWTAPQVSSGTAKNYTRDIIDMDLIFTKLGHYEDREYYIYDTHLWMGEVGGLACLLLFLHGAFVYIVMEIAAKVYNQKHPSGASLSHVALNDR